MFGINNAFPSWFVYTTRVDVSLLERVHVLFLDFCRKNCSIYIGLEISEVMLYMKMGFLTDKGKADSFIEL